LEKTLFLEGRTVFLMDGDNIRHGLNRDLGFTPEARSENLRRAAEVAKFFVEAGHLVLATFISPTISDRSRVRAIVGERDFLEIHVSTPLEVCEQRDPKGLYSRARAGEVTQFTGVSAPWEPPPSPDLDLPAHKLSVEESITRIQALLTERGIFLGAHLPGGGGI
jgi:adenylyl-sulfate kinase